MMSVLWFLRLKTFEFILRFLKVEPFPGIFKNEPIPASLSFIFVFFIQKNEKIDFHVGRIRTRIVGKEDAYAGWKFKFQK